MRTSEPVRAPPEVSRTRGHRLAKPRQIALSSNLGRSNPRSQARRWVLAARSWKFLSLPNFAPEVFVHARRHVFVVRMRDVFAYRLRVLEAVTANAAMPLVAGEDVRAPLGAFRVVFGIGHFQNPVKRTATTTVTAPTTTAGQGWPRSLSRLPRSRKKAAPSQKRRDRGWYDASAWRQHSDYGRVATTSQRVSQRPVQPLSRRQTIATFEMGRSSPCTEQPCRRNRKWRILVQARNDFWHHEVEWR